MLTREANERLTQVGLGTPMGALLRRYWHPIATLPELMSEPVLAVTVLGENLALYRTDAGDSTFRDRVHIPAYPVQEMGGLIWAYLGPTPAPLLPRFDLFVRDDLEREIGITRLPCNWLQIMENSLDPVHLEYLHSVYMNYVLKRQGKPPASQTKHHERIAFDVFEYGIIKRRLWEGDSEDTDEWRVGHPILFPNILSVGEGGRAQFQIRTPIDDTHTYHVWYRTKPRGEKTPLQDPATIPVLDYAYKHEDGRLVVDTVSGQDMMVW